MVYWLRRQEAVDRFAAYLNFTQPQPAVPAPAVESGTLIIQSTSSRSTSLSSTASTQIARHPARELCGITAQQIVDRHRATQFIPALKHYLRNSGCNIIPNQYDTFDLYKRLAIHLSEIAETSKAHCKDVVRAIPPIPPKAQRAAEAAHMDFALIRVSETNATTAGTPLAGECQYPHIVQTR